MAKQIKVIFLGGIGEIGKNMTAIEYGQDIVVIDAGLAFPTTDMPGIDLVIPDFNYLTENKDRIRGFLLTHGHEDHIGAMPFVLQSIKAPVYGTKLTLALVEHKLIEHKIKDFELKPIEYYEKIKLGNFVVEFLKVSHSITGAASIVIETPIGTIFHTGDYKIDFTPIDGASMDLGKFASIGNKKVLLMLGESTNVEHEGYSMSERTVGEALDKVFAANNTRRIIVATFASNVHRVQQIIDLADKYGRRVALSGRSMINISEMAIKIDELKPKSPFVPIEKIKSVPDDKLVIICTGSQGEPMSALTRMASGNSKIKISSNDAVIISSTPIPGNEKSVYNVINNLYRKGANVIYEALYEVHVSGHACKEEMKTMLSLIKPEYFIPVHGEYRHLAQHVNLAVSMGIPRANILVPDLGDVIEVRRSGISKGQQVKAGQLLIDGANVGDMASLILRDRILLAEDGIIIALLSFSLENGDLITEPELITKGLNLSDELMLEAKKIIESVIKNFKMGKIDEKDDVKIAVRKALKKFLFSRVNKNPMILPIIMQN